MEALTNYEILIDKIEVFIRKYYLNKVLRGTLLVGAVIFCGFVLVLFSEYLGNFNSTVRGILFYGYLLVNTGLFGWLVLPPLLSYLKLGRIISHEEAARIIGEHFNHVEDKLLNTLQLKRLADEHPDQRRLIEASIDQRIISIKPVTFPSAVRIKENVKHVKWVVLPLGVILILAIAAPAMLRENAEKIIKHNQYFAVKSPFQFIVTNEQLTVVQGDDLKLHVKLTGNRFPNDVYVETAKNTFKMDKEGIGRFNYLFPNLQQNLKFRLVGSDFKSQEYEVTVHPKPSLLHFEAHLNYPSYLKRKNEHIGNAGDLTLPAGTTVTWQVHTQNASRLLFNLNGNAEQLTSDNNTFFKTERITRSGSYLLRTMSNIAVNGDSVGYHINVIADQPPTISVNEKQDSVSSKAIYFSGKAQDDYGFSSLIFHYSIKGRDAQKARIFELPVKAELGNNQMGFFYFWNLKELHINPGEQISYYFQVADNNAVTGHQTARTLEHTLNIPSETEISQQLNANVESVKDKMQSAIKLAAQIDKDIKKLNEMLLNKANLSFDDKKQIQDLLDKRQELKKMIEDAQQQNQKNAQNRQENMPQDKDLAEKQNRMERLMKDLMDPKTDEMLKMLQKMMDNKLENPASKELSKMQMDDKALSQQLNRTLELMKLLDVHTKVKENINQLNKLADKQQQLADQTKQSGADTKALQQKQAEIKKDFADVKKSLDDVKEKNDQLENATNFENPKPDLQKIDDQLNKSSSDLAQNKKNEANTEQQQAANKMQQLAQKMQKKLQEEELQDIVINGKDLRNLIKKLVESSFTQENIIANLKQIKEDDPSYPKWAQKQRDIQANMKTAQDSLTALGNRLPDIESTVINETALLNQNIEQAVKFLEERRTWDANKNQVLAMTSMNNLALMLSETLTKMQEAMKQTPKAGGAPSGGGARKRKTILELSALQEKLNANMQAMRDKMRQTAQQQGQAGNKPQNGNQPGGPGDGGPMSEQFAKMARQQAEIRQAIEQLNREENKDGHHQLGDLASLSKHMERTEADLVNKNLTEATLSRQLQIRTRLLEAEKADQQRDQDSKRESKAPQNDIPPGFIKALQAFEQEKSKQTEQLKTTPTTLNDYYKFKVRAYFEQVNKQ
ncbi:DUF4175 family protein [Mucilaginibacter sp. SMC90]|uniref:DUF4175 family protein n=1 Tax=Mucilaginibacter sp. SMC90 TaxID=2929803 RepID=UPI001FB35654|nr:DUF4175 family protein [Mucilaginibacter sp. SMC90]UOE47749.1 DUF4175 family protein [Mucilaginibacter sp. SMC90]